MTTTFLRLSALFAATALVAMAFLYSTTPVRPTMFGAARPPACAIVGAVLHVKRCH